MARLLSVGMRGDDVTDLQAKLNTWPSALARLTADGAFGNLTRQRVMEFQRDSKLTVDGIAGPQTMAALDAPRPSDDDGGATDLEQYYFYAASLVRRLPGRTGQASRFFDKQLAFVQGSAKSSLQVRADPQQRNFVAATSTVAGPSGGGGGGGRVGVAPLVVVGVAAAVVILLFAMAAAMQMAQNAKQSAKDLAKLEREFEQKILELNRAIAEDSAEAIVLLAVAMNAVYTAIRAQIDRLQKLIEECRRSRPPQDQTRCLRLLDKIAEQMRDIVSRATLQNFQRDEARKLLLLGLARSMGFLLQLVSDYAKCMGCPAIQFL